MWVRIYHKNKTYNIHNCFNCSYFSAIFLTQTHTVKFYDQYLSISTKLPSNYNLYGIGEHVTPYLRLQPRTYTLWTYDTPTPQYLNLCKSIIQCTTTYTNNHYYLNQQLTLIMYITIEQNSTFKISRSIYT